MLLLIVVNNMNEHYPVTPKHEQDNEQERLAVASLTAAAHRAFEQYPPFRGAEKQPDGSIKERVRTHEVGERYTGGHHFSLDLTRITAPDGTVSYKQSDIYGRDEWTTRTWTEGASEVRVVDVEGDQPVSDELADLDKIRQLQERIDRDYPPKVVEQPRLRRFGHAVRRLVTRRG